MFDICVINAYKCYMTSTPDAEVHLRIKPSGQGLREMCSCWDPL